MKKNGHKLLTLAALLGTATGVIHITNRFIDATSQLKDMLEQPHGKTYDWRFGKIHYTKQGHGFSTASRSRYNARRIWL